MNQWHVIFVRSGSEEKIKQRFNSSEDFMAFIPKKMVYHRKQGIVSKKEEILFKGYVFIETSKNAKDLRIYLAKELKGATGYIKLLGDQSDHEIQSISVEERNFLERFTNKERVIDTSIGFIVGDRVTITEGPLMGHESSIKKIDRHKRTAELEVLMFGQINNVKVACEIISKR